MANLEFLVRCKIQVLEGKMEALLRKIEVAQKHGFLIEAKYLGLLYEDVREMKCWLSLDIWRELSKNE